MHRLAAVCVIAALAPGCVTTYGVYKHQDDVSRADLITAGALDLGGITAFMFAAESEKIPLSFLIGVVTTAVDFGVACLLGSCKALHHQEGAGSGAASGSGSASPPPQLPADGPGNLR